MSRIFKVKYSSLISKSIDLEKVVSWEHHQFTTGQGRKCYDGNKTLVTMVNGTVVVYAPFEEFDEVMENYYKKTYQRK